MNAKALIKLLEAQGWVLDRIRGSHHIFKNGERTVVVPVHGTKDLPKGTVESIMKDGGLK